MMSSLRSLSKSRSVQSVCVKLIACHPIYIRRSFKMDPVTTKLDVKKLTEMPKRFLSAQELSPPKRIKAYPWPDQTKMNVSKNLVFVDNENQMAFKIIDSLLSKQKFELSKKNPIISTQTQDVLDKFLKIDPDNYRNSYLIEGLAEVMKNLSLQQIYLILKSMTKWPVINSPFSKVFYKTWSYLDRELENRLNKVNFSENNQVLEYLFVGNMFYRLKIANISKFNYLLVKKLSSPDFELNKTSLVHLMFYINLHRRVNPNTVPFLLKQCESLVKDMNLNEIGVICMTLFKTGTTLSDELAKLVISKTLTDISEQIDNIIRCAITKSLRRSANLRIQPQIGLFLDEMKKLSNNSELTVTHLLNLMKNAMIYDQELIAQVFDKVWSEPTSFRLKDIERILLSLSYFDCHLDYEKLKFICDELHIKSDLFLIYQYPMCLLNILHYLSILGHYPQPLIEHCFEPTFLAKMLKHSRIDYQRHLLIINTALSLEKYEEFKEILVPPEKVYRYYRWILTQEKSGPEKLTKRAILINSIYMTLRSELKGRVQLCHIFPFKSYPFVVIFDKQNRNFSLSPKIELKANMFDNCHVFHILDIQDFAIIDTMVKGNTQLESRLLKRLGFKVVTITWHHLTQFTTSRARRNKLMAELSAIDPHFQV